MANGATGNEPGWTFPTWQAHTREVRELEDRLLSERDRRYAEVNIEREKALKIKEEADKAALGLAREIQTYKDEKANELRSQIERERGNYATRTDLLNLGEKFEQSQSAFVAEMRGAIKPLAEFVTTQQGRVEQRADTRTGIQFTLGQVAAVVSVLIAIVGVVILLANTIGR